MGKHFRKGLQALPLNSEMTRFFLVNYANRLLVRSVKLSFEINSLGNFILTYSFENSSIPNSSVFISFNGNDTSFTVLYPKYFKVVSTACLEIC